MTHDNGAPEYQEDIGRHRPIEVDGVDEAPEENAGVRNFGRVLGGSIWMLVGVILGAAIVHTANWWQDRPKPVLEQLTSHQIDLLTAAANPNNRGFNDQAIGALVANGYRPVAQQTDSHKHTYYVVMAKCGDLSDRECFDSVKSPASPVVYLGIPDELTDSDSVVRFQAASVMVDFPAGNRTQRCVIYQGKAQTGEPGAISYNLPMTIDRLRSFAAGREFVNQSPDGDLTFWRCS